MMPELVALVVVVCYCGVAKSQTKARWVLAFRCHCRPGEEVLGTYALHECCISFALASKLLS